MSFWEHRKFANTLMSQYDLADTTSEIMCSQATTEITCSISSASQHTNWTRKRLFAWKRHKEPVYEPITSHDTQQPHPLFLHSFSSPVPDLTANIPSQPCFCRCVFMGAEGLAKGRVRDCSSELLWIPWMDVCRCEIGQEWQVSPSANPCSNTDLPHFWRSKLLNSQVSF